MESRRNHLKNEQENSERAAYGKQILKELSKKLSAELGKGFSVSNLYNMRLFYLCYPDFPQKEIFQTPSGKLAKQQKSQTLSVELSWSHYCELLLIEDKERRSFYEKECINSKWSVRELKRQIETSLFERLLLSSGTENKKRVLELAEKGNELSSPSDIIKDPYVFEFLGVPENKPILESDLEKSLVEHIEKFLLELGRGFMFVGSQQRITLGNEHYYVDMVFYNKILHSYVLIELKQKSLCHKRLGS